MVMGAQKNLTCTEPFSSLFGELTFHSVGCVVRALDRISAQVIGLDFEQDRIAVASASLWSSPVDIII